MELQDVYITWVNTLHSPHTIKRYKGNLRRFCYVVWGKEPYNLTFDDLKGVTVQEIKSLFHQPMRDRGHSKNTIQAYYVPVRGFVEKINQSKIFSEPINTEKFRVIDKIPTKGDLLKRLDELENEIADIRATLAAYEAS
ncbi:hypothetical protein EFO75_05190 [Limosilactobacillus reuteri]|uniref:hypothetical protein n=1 Tax=Limosilactobacillus reuteri TaxID=1598 RepID=UPI0021A936ED|nr:hypothetical protein [Limosilactobacillus reuteri]MCT3208061.1 hypothetical protein [Limosilactobacillus reuteri]MCT3216662.1 hypothetical protein [Limosilactobacillus reuteri]